MAKLGAQMKMSTRAVGTIMRHKSRYTEGCLQFADFATKAMHISHKTRGNRACQMIAGSGRRILTTELNIEI
eukprot:CAMPEP_0201601124 /NCGR_PEP_ID=MMETSP0492-20130828/2135_1 /ASSEMBLY_ACC=CAM_ASM_000837 /TAXON_ID=420259 /ORGANISM="Thalassiosira gravida, Strain GMp14c1" /LENGTH=71 /DNA_ID=CAMNT_0048064227 /DNA_START=814 /DNA_END=1029 /DNA_ORIENTATION=-